MEKTTFDTSGQSVQKSPEGLFLQDGIAGLRSLPRVKDFDRGSQRSAHGREGWPRRPVW